MVPAERFELPTNGLQNRCSTTELSRRELSDGAPRRVILSAARTAGRTRDQLRRAGVRRRSRVLAEHIGHFRLWLVGLELEVDPVLNRRALMHIQRGLEAE